MNDFVSLVAANELLKLADSLHTEGFYKRESSLVRQLTGTHEATPKLSTTARAKGKRG